MQCNGSPFNLDRATKWWFVFEKTAKQELEVRPTTDVVFGMEFYLGSEYGWAPEVSGKRPGFMEVLAGFESCD